MKTMGIDDASQLLRVHPVTLSKMASSGEIPAAKIGKEWVFIEVDLIDYIRAQYKTRALEGERKETLCHFTNAKTQPFGGSKSVLADNRQYNVLLGLKTKSKPKNSTIG
jgi:excisionase family DNA binding protein